MPKIKLTAKQRRQIEKHQFNGVFPEVDLIELFIQQAARSVGRTYYQAIGRAFDVPYERGALGPTLAEISRRSLLTHGFLLSAIVTHKDGEMFPGEGFFDLFMLWDIPFKSSKAGRDEAWIEQFNLVHAHYRQPVQLRRAAP